MAQFAVLFGDTDFETAGAQPPAEAVSVEAESWHKAVRSVWNQQGGLNDTKCLVWRDGKPAAVVQLDFSGRELASMAQTPP